MTKYLLSIFTVIYLCTPAFADTSRMDIGIFRDVKTSQVMLSYLDNEYSIYCDSSLVYTLKTGHSIRIKTDDNRVRLIDGDNEIGAFSKLTIKEKGNEGGFKIKCLYPKTSTRKYRGDLEIKPDGRYLKIINKVSLEQYLVGVIESETGNYESVEFYKVQAVISRTYALKHKTKFLHQGFMLTDLTNCQVYKGKMYKNPKIIQAVRETKNLVLVDDEMNYITAAYFSNSGGQTVNSEDVWNKPLSYLKSIKDPYSNGKSQFRWTKTIDKNKWISYLQKKHKYPINDSSALEDALSFKQKNRHKYYVDWKYHILLTDIRKHWKLKSTFFSIEDQGEKIVLKGKGFGHGVGLSQQGAMNMCDLGFEFLDVLLFYYTQAHLIDLEMRDFYLSE